MIEFKGILNFQMVDHLGTISFSEVDIFNLSLKQAGTQLEANATTLTLVECGCIKKINEPLFGNRTGFFHSSGYR
jgi:hypothetical protein